MSIDPNFPNLYLSLLALAGGLAMLVAGGEGLVSGASKFALLHGMRPMVVGLTIVAFGTSMPELFVSINAALNGHADIMIGNVIGSNIANIGLVLAISALLMALPVTFRKIQTEIILVVGASILVAGISYLGYFQRFFGLLFVGGLIIYTIYVCRTKKSQDYSSDIAKDLTVADSNLKIIGLQAGGLLLLALGSDLFIDGAVDVAVYLGVSELVVGLTVAAVGTSLPELASSIAAVRRHQSDILVGNIVGSNMFNLMMVMGGTAMIRPFALDRVLLGRDLPVMILFSAVLVPIFAFRQQLDRYAGGLLLLGYCAYIFCVV